MSKPPSRVASRSAEQRQNGRCAARGGRRPSALMFQRSRSLAGAASARTAERVAASAASSNRSLLFSTIRRCALLGDAGWAVDRAVAGLASKHSQIFEVELGRSVDDQKHDVRATHGFAGSARRPGARPRLRCLARSQAGGVHQLDGQATHGDRFGDDVARGAGGGGDDGAGALHQGIKERGLAGVGTA